MKVLFIRDNDQYNGITYMGKYKYFRVRNVSINAYLLAQFGIVLFLVQTFLDIHLINDYYTLFISLGILSVSLILHRGGKIDFCALLLVFRCLFLSLVNLSNTDLELSSYLNGSYFSCYVAVIAYMVSKEFSNKRYMDFLYKCFYVCYTVMFFQVIVCFQSYRSIDFNSRKYFINIPFGNSNSIAMIAFTIGLFLIFYEDKRWKKNIWIVMMAIFSIVLSSKGGIIVLCTILLSRKLFSKIRTWSIKRKRIYMLVGMILAGSIFVLINKEYIFNIIAGVVKPLLDRIEMFFTGDVNGATTNRTIVFSSYIKRIIRKPLFGYGTEPVVAAFQQYEAMRPHNLILEALFQGGIVNLLMYLGAIACAFCRDIGYNKENNAAKIACVFLLLHSMIEPGLFTLNKDFVFWLLLGTRVVYKENDSV